MFANAIALWPMDGGGGGGGGDGDGDGMQGSANGSFLYILDDKGYEMDSVEWLGQVKLKLYGRKWVFLFQQQTGRRRILLSYIDREKRRGGKGLDHLFCSFCPRCGGGVVVSGGRMWDVGCGRTLPANCHLNNYSPHPRIETSPSVHLDSSGPMFLQYR